MNPGLFVRSKRLFSYVGLVVVTFLTLIVALLLITILPNQIPAMPPTNETISLDQWLPSVSYNIGLHPLAAYPPTTTLAIGVLAPRGIDEADNLTLTNITANEFNSVTALPFFSAIRPCPPQWMVQEYIERENEEELVLNPDYNAKVVNEILTRKTFPCYSPLSYAINNPEDINRWLWYAYEARPRYESVDKVVAWQNANN